MSRMPRPASQFGKRRGRCARAIARHASSPSRPAAYNQVHGHKEAPQGDSLKCKTQRLGSRSPLVRQTRRLQLMRRFGKQRTPGRRASPSQQLRLALLVVPAICGMLFASFTRPLCSPRANRSGSSEQAHCCSLSTVPTARNCLGIAEDEPPLSKGQPSHSDGCCPEGCPASCMAPCCAIKPYLQSGRGIADLLAKPACIGFAAHDRSEQIASTTLDSVFHPPRA